MELVPVDAIDEKVKISVRKTDMYISFPQTNFEFKIRVVRILNYCSRVSYMCKIRHTVCESLKSSFHTKPVLGLSRLIIRNIKIPLV